MPSVRGLVVAVCAASALSGCGANQDLAERQAQVADLGAEVMPFSLDQTTHIFTDTQRGGRQDVVADNPTDGDTIAEIRAHLAEEVRRFSQGDFSDPEAIHGAQMPGLAELKSGYEQIDVKLQETPEGASITYETENRELISAIHLWFNAQGTDHGDHAEHNQ